MNIEQSVEELKLFINSIRSDLEEDAEDNFRTVKAIETLLTAYEKEKEKKEELIKERAKEIIYVDRNFIRKDKIKPIQIIDLDGKIHNVYKIEEE
jgi:hypothetical protein